MNTANKFLKSTFLVVIVVIASKLMGFVRDAIIASYFGATEATDAFFFATSMPGIPALAMTISTVFLPVYIARREKDGLQESNRYASNILSCSCAVALGISGVAIVFSPLIVRIFAPGFSGETRQLSIDYFRIVMCFYVLVMINYILNALLNANKVFGRAQLTGIILNVAYIVFIPIGVRWLGINTLLASYVMATAAQVSLLIYFSRKIFKYTPDFRLNSDAQNLFKLSIPVMLGNAVIDIQESVDKMIASLLSAGSISVMTYGLTLSNVVKGTLVNAVSSVYYPYISENIVNFNEENVCKFINKTLSSLVMVLLPVSVITVICSKDIVYIVYQHGNFSHQTATLTASILACYAIGFPFNGLREISAKTLYSMGKMAEVTKNGIIAVVINVVLSFILSIKIGISGIALATAVADVVASMLLLSKIKTFFKSFSVKYAINSLLKIIVGGLVLAAFCHYLMSVTAESRALWRFVFISVLGCSLYLFCMIVLKQEEMMFLLNRILKLLKIKKEK